MIFRPKLDEHVDRILEICGKSSLSVHRHEVEQELERVRTDTAEYLVRKTLDVGGLTSVSIVHSIARNDFGVMV